ncbi:MAG TPA: UDP-3-O-(3-hydroxymyristoyl)glucosamine N-acyltransferase [Pirellulales bacterium]|jgi:UDP-3-O-[3-hydroxymyristoyl] glucosamine N-acyltransferase|nr:UDP-3-O-(3-hydroxymyristoyl)glucosamine N-acyltransferase [Pirellulales bacterium]
MMPTTLAALAQLVDGEVVGDGALAIRGAATLLDAQPGEITLADRNEKADRLAAAKASAAVVPQGFPLEALTMPAIVVADVHRAFTAIVMQFRPPRVAARSGISPAAFIDASARLGKNVDVHAGATIGADVEIGAGSTIHSGARIMAGCRLGEQVTIYPNAVLYEGTLVGARSVVHAGVVLGCHGFGYRVFEGNNLPSAQLGWVQVGSDCEIGACTTIDRGTYGPTIVGDGTKVDNLVMIAHNCRIGKHNMICSQVGIAGSTMTGDHVVMAGQVGVRDHISIGDGAVLGAKAGVSNDIPARAHVFGTPAIPERDQKIQFAAISKLPDMRRQLKALQHAVDALLGAEQQSKGNAA